MKDNLHTGESGFTLIELLVYIAIMGFIIIVAGRVFSDSTVMRVRSQNMVKTSEELGKVSNLLKEDISQMGIKAGAKAELNAYTIDVHSDVYWNASLKDSSSYSLARNENFDELVFRKAEFDEDGEYIGISEITWSVENGNLFRKSVALTDDEEDTEAVLVMSNVTRFTINPSRPGITGNASSTNNPDTLFPSTSNSAYFNLLPRTAGSNVNSSISIESSNYEVTVQSFAKNSTDDKNFNQLYLTESQNQSNWDRCTQLDFKRGETYVVEFRMPFFKSGDKGKNDSNSTQFLPGMDHIAIGLRELNNNEETNDIEAETISTDVLFYPPQSAEAADLPRRAEFSVSRDTKACVAFTFAFYSPKASTGKIRFSNFKVFRKADEAFHFPGDGYGVLGNVTSDEHILIKKNVKAFELVMEIENRGEKSGTYSIDENGNINGMIIATPNNGVAVIPSSELSNEPSNESSSE